MEKVKGYKVFNQDWTCRDKQYTCPGKFEEEVNPIVCGKGMHFCKKAVDCFNYYNFDSNNKVAEVIAFGTIAEDGDKCSTDKLEIIRELPWEEVLNIVNSGEWNTGHRNSGHSNSGDWNSGHRNSGHRNSGDRNSGDWNSGHRNSGDRNSGDWNSTNFSNGCFNTEEPKIYLFNKPSDWSYSDWLYSDARRILFDIGEILEYVYFDQMTDEEKKEHPEAEITGGYLKDIDNAEYRVEKWKQLSAEDKKTVMSIPNFDKEIFKKITGIDVEGE